MNPVDIERRLRSRFVEACVTALKSLLEEKHLYQAVHIPRDVEWEEEQLAKLPSGPHGSPLGAIKLRHGQLLGGPWFISSPAIPNYPGRLAGEAPAPLVIPLPDARLFCRSCGSREPFNPVAAEDLGAFPNTVIPGTSTQSFAFTFVCQGCKGLPEAFLVRREKFRLILSGRSPMGQIEVPSVIPKSVRQFFSGAVVAYNTGFALAGNFMLRTLIEQWARQASGSGESRAELVIDTYAALLPEDFRQRFPSLKALYGELSSDLHEAAGCESLFLRCREAIVQHFEARRLFGLS